MQVTQETQKMITKKIYTFKFYNKKLQWIQDNLEILIDSNDH